MVHIASIRVHPLRAVVALASLVIVSASAHGNAYPQKPVRFIVAYPAGGSADLIARVIGQKLADSFQQTFVIDNRGGAGGLIGEELAAKSAPDGHTLLLVSISHVVNPQLNAKLNQINRGRGIGPTCNAE